MDKLRAQLSSVMGELHDKTVATEKDERSQEENEKVKIIIILQPKIIIRRFDDSSDCCTHP